MHDKQKLGSKRVLCKRKSRAQADKGRRTAKPAKPFIRHQATVSAEPAAIFGLLRRNATDMDDQRETSRQSRCSLSTASQSIRNTSSDCDGAPSLTPLPRRCALSLRPPLLGTLPKVYTTTTTARVLGETSLRHLTTISLSAHPPTTSPSQNITPPPPPPPRCTWFFEVFSILPQSSQVQPWEMSNARHLLQPPP